MFAGLEVSLNTLVGLQKSGAKRAKLNPLMPFLSMTGLPLPVGGRSGRGVLVLVAVIPPFSRGWPARAPGAASL